MDSVRLRHGEKAFLNALNRDESIRYPVQGKVAETAEKVSLIIQTELGLLGVADKFVDYQSHVYQMKKEMIVIFQLVVRLAKCLVDCLINAGDGISLLNCLNVLQCFSAHCWNDSCKIFRQLPNIRDASCMIFQAKGLRNLEQLHQLKSYEIEKHLGRKPPFGTTLIAAIDKFPKLALNMQSVNESIKITIRMVGGARSTQGWTNLLVYGEDGKILEFRRFRIASLYDEVSVSIPNSTKTIKARLICETMSMSTKFSI